MRIKEAAERLMKSKYLPLFFLLGAALMLFSPPAGGKAKDETPPEPAAREGFDAAAEERRLEEALSKIDGAGEIKVLLSLKNGERRVLAENGGEPVVISSGSGSQSVVEVTSLSPEYMGAVVVCQGGDRADVRLSVTRAVSVYTGLGSDKITVIKMKS